MRWFFLVVELFFVAAVVAGVALMHIPSAFIVGGVLGVLIIERSAIPMLPAPRKGKK